MTIDVTILTLMLPLGILLLSLGAGLLTAAISLVYHAKSLDLETSEDKKKLAREIRCIVYVITAVLVIAFVIGATFYGFT